MSTEKLILIRHNIAEVKRKTINRKLAETKYDISSQVKKYRATSRQDLNNGDAKWEEVTR